MIPYNSIWGPVIKAVSGKTIYMDPGEDLLVELTRKSGLDLKGEFCVYSLEKCAYTENLPHIAWYVQENETLTTIVNGRRFLGACYFKFDPSVTVRYRKVTIDTPLDIK